MFPGLDPFDGAVMTFVQQHLHSPISDAFFLFVTHLGEGGAVWLLLGFGLCAFKKTRLCGVCVLISLALTFLTGELLLKSLAARPRPCDDYPAVALLLPHPGGYSFPSSHASSSFAAAVSLFLRFRKPGIAALLLAALIAFSRVLLFVHYPTDVLAGAALGTLLALLVFLAADRISARQR